MNDLLLTLDRLAAKIQSCAATTLLCLPLTAAGIALPAPAEEISEPETPAVDCPLRNERYSVGSPLMDILLKPEAAAVVNNHMASVLEKLPPSFASPSAPSFSAILTVRNLASMAGQGPEVVEAIDRDLSLLEVTVADRVARCARYDLDPPTLEIPDGRPRILLFEKITGFRDTPSVDAASAALREIADRKSWTLVATDNGAAILPEMLSNFDVVIWNNISGDVLTLAQRQAFKDYITSGGGYVGVHGSAGDPNYFWDWYVDELLGARFIGHPSDPQFQDARVQIESTPSGIGRGLAPGWLMNEEWYSFKISPRTAGASVIATLDESTYSPIGRGGQDLRMGDHPIVWTRCVGDGRSFYSAIGHRPEVYTAPEHIALLEQGIAWAAGRGPTNCQKGVEKLRD